MWNMMSNDITEKIIELVGEIFEQMVGMNCMKIGSRSEKL